MPRCIIKQFFVLVTLLGTLPYANAEPLKYKIGEEFILKTYKDTPSVFLRIETIGEHPYIDAYYIVSFWGICQKRPGGLSKEGELSWLGPVVISNKALNESIILNEYPDKKNSLICNDEQPKVDFEMWKNGVMIGTGDVMVSPLHSRMSLFATETFISLVHN